MNRIAWTRTAALVAGLLVVQALMVGIFAWSAARTAPAGVPLVVAGPTEATQAVAERIELVRPGAFEIEQVSGEGEARAALLQRDAYAAVVLTPAPRLLVASAASPNVAMLVREALGPALAAASGAAPASAPAVEDVVAADPDDPRQGVLGASLLPLVLTGMAGGALLTVLVGRRRQVLAGITAFSALGGLLVTAILHTWLGAVPSGFAATSGVIALALLAITATVAGLGAVLRRGGLALAAVTLVLVGNPAAGLSSAPEMLPGWWGGLGQLLPPGAAGSLLRRVAFFDDASLAPALPVLLAWVAAGLGLLFLAAATGRAPVAAAHQPAPTATPTPATAPRATESDPEPAGVA